MARVVRPRLRRRQHRRIARDRDPRRRTPPSCWRPSWCASAPPNACSAEDDSGLGSALPSGAVPTLRGPELFALSAATRAVVRCFGGAPESSGLAEQPLAMRALGALLAYVGEARPGHHVAHSATRACTPWAARWCSTAPRAATWTCSSRPPGQAVPRCCSVLDRTATPMGARLLRAVLGQPLLDAERINERLDGVERLVRDAALRTPSGRGAARPARPGASGHPRRAGAADAARVPGAGGRPRRVPRLQRGPGSLRRPAHDPGPLLAGAGG